MKWLVRLYPAAWRTRYEDEFLALLTEHRASPLDYLDLIVSIVFTRFNPGFRAPPRPTLFGSRVGRPHAMAFPDNMRDMLLEQELYRTRSNNGQNM